MLNPTNLQKETPASGATTPEINYDPSVLTNTAMNAFMLAIMDVITKAIVAASNPMVTTSSISKPKSSQLDTFDTS